MKKVKLFLAVMICLTFIFPSFSQITYERLHGKASTFDGFEKAAATPDGGYIATGLTQSSGKLAECYVVKYDADGLLEFEQKFGTNQNEKGESVAVLSDRYIVGGSQFQPTVNTKDCYLISLDLDGNLINEITYGGDGEDEIIDLIALENGQIAVAATYETDGDNGGDINVRIYDADLNLIAENTVGTTDLDIAGFIKEVSTGDIIVSGSTVETGLLYSLSSDLSTVNWSQVGNNSALEYRDFLIGLETDGNDFYLLSSSANDFTGHLLTVDLMDGSFLDDYQVFIDFPSPTPLDMVMAGANIYILTRSNDVSIYTFSTTSLSFESASEVFQFEGALDLTSHGNELIGMAGVDRPFDYSVAKMVQVNMADGSKNWEETIGDFTSSSTYIGVAISEALDGGMYLAGSIITGNEPVDVNVRKVDISGVTVWETIFGEFDDFDETWAITTAQDGGCVVAYESSGFDRALQKISSDGDLEWSQPITNDAGEFLFPVFGNITTGLDGSFYYAYTKTTDNTRKAQIIRVSATGETIWEKEYQIEDFGTRAYNIITAANGDLLIGCQVETPSAEPGMFRINPDGDLLWANMFELNQAFARFTGITEAADGTIYGAGGVSVSPDAFGNGPGNIIHMDANGNFLDGGLVEDNDPFTLIYDITMLDDGSIYTVSLVTEELPTNVSSLASRVRTTEIHEYNQDLSVVDIQSFGLGLNPVIYRMITHSDGGLAAFGSANLNNNRHQYLIRINAEGASSNVEIKSQGNLKIQPTISDGSFDIDFTSAHLGEMTIKIYDANGQVVHTFNDEKSTENWNQSVHLPELAAGTYFVNCQLEGFAWTRQMMKQ